MSNLRLFGIIIGISGLFIAFLFFRGARWNKYNYLMATTSCFFLALVSYDPNTLDWMRDFLSLEQSELGRLLGLLIISVVSLFGILFYTRFQIQNYRVLLDRLIRGLGSAEIKNFSDLSEKMKPVMIIIPAYNEAENLKVLLPAMPKIICGVEVGLLVIDDGSTDGTSEVAKNHDVLVVRNIINRGQGASSRLGYDILRDCGVKVGVTMDADNQHRPEDIKCLISPILADEYDLVIGSRILGNRDQDSSFRYMGIIILTALINLLTGQKLTDCSSGFKAFRIDKICSLKLYEEQFQAAELLIMSVKSGFRIGEAPIFVKLRQHGVSKKGTNFTYGFSFGKTIIKTWWR